MHECRAQDLSTWPQGSQSGITQGSLYIKPTLSLIDPVTLGVKDDIILKSCSIISWRDRCKDNCRAPPPLVYGGQSPTISGHLSIGALAHTLWCIENVNRRRVSIIAVNRVAKGEPLTSNCSNYVNTVRIFSVLAIVSEEDNLIDASQAVDRAAALRVKGITRKHRWSPGSKRTFSTVLMKAARATIQK